MKKHFLIVSGFKLVKSFKALMNVLIDLKDLRPDLDLSLWTADSFPYVTCEEMIYD